MLGIRIRKFIDRKKQNLAVPSGPRPIRFIGHGNRVRDWTPEDILSRDDVRGHLASMRRNWQTNPAEFDEDVLPILNLAVEWFGPLPSSERHHHSTPAGMVRHLFETAYYCIQRQGGYAPDENMRGQALIKNGRSFTQALVLTAILHDVGKIMTDMEVRCGEDRSVVWNPFFESLFEFCQRAGSSHIEWSWISGRHQKHEDPRYALWMAGLWAGRLGVHLTLPIAQKLIAALAHEEFSDLWDAAKKADGLSASQDRRMIAEEFTEQKPDPLRVICQSIQSLFDSRRWTYNRKGCPIWFTKFGVVLVDDLAFRHIVENLQMASQAEEEFRFEHSEEVKQKLLDLGVIRQYETATQRLAYKIKFKPETFGPKTAGLFGTVIEKPELIGLVGLENIKPVGLTVAETEDGTKLEAVMSPIEADLSAKAAIEDSPESAQAGVEENAKKESVGKDSQSQGTAKHESIGEERRDSGKSKKKKGAPSEEEEKMLGAFLDWLIGSLENKTLVLTEDRNVIKEEPGLWVTESGIFMSGHPVMLFCSLSKAADGVPANRVRELLKSIKLLAETEEEGLFRVSDELKEEILKAGKMAHET